MCILVDIGQSIYKYELSLHGGGTRLVQISKLIFVLV